ncbi:hypothetical protein N658DRAFT_486676 [Parathielavia hyrcaniae]|uniref:Rhodopsin domain-containing protein n=1 Tax=Parathielavia hyrcaniae TaxID=113614 RepID=A0AAN6Q1M5_9PEZI|nr:hypothetical protein N658DRAFT_486676 [Parathielavia hyrcaniae]
MSDAAEAAAVEAALAAARAFNITLWTLYAVGVLVTGLRTYARVKAVGWKRFEADDYLVWAAVVSRMDGQTDGRIHPDSSSADRGFHGSSAQLLYSTQTTLGYEVGNLARGMANNGMTDAQRAALSPTSPEYGMRIVGSKIQVAGWSCYSTLMLVLKLAMSFFYLRLTNGLGRPYRLRVHAGFAIVIAGYLASMVAILFACMPFHHYWQIHPDPGNVCQPAVSRPIVWASFAANVSSDIYLILIPLPLLWQSRLRLVEKIASSLVLGAGIFVLVCATLKTVFVIVRYPGRNADALAQDDVNGAELAGAWGTREAFVAVVTTNLPMVFPLFKAWLRPLLGSSARNTDKQYKTPDGFRSIGGGGGGGGSSGPRSHNRRATHHSARVTTNPLTNVTFTESEERIVNDIKLRDVKAVASSPGAQGGQANNNNKSNDSSNKGIVVMTEFDISEDRTSQHEQNAARVHEPW